jgi:phenylacetaldehyde dehydrogenase
MTIQIAPAPSPAGPAADFARRAHGLLIGGRWIPAASGKTFDVIDPATGKSIAKVAEGDKADADAAVEAARKAFAGPWSRMSPTERGKLIWRFADAIDGAREELATLNSLENGKPINDSLKGEAPFAAETFRYYAGWATKINGEQIPISAGGDWHCYTRREAVGVAAQIIPWNFPLAMLAWKVAPALAAGCTMVLKPAEQTPLGALRLAELFAEAGFPEGVLNVVTGFGETAGAALAAHPQVDKVAFTGSTEVGKIIARAATDNLKKVSLELGGKSPTIIMDDADLETAIAGASDGIFFNMGQCCTAGSRLFVHKKVYDRILSGVSTAAGRLRIGPGLDPASQIGPLVFQEQYDKVTGFIDEGRRDGAEIVAGGAKIETTVITCRPPSLPRPGRKCRSCARRYSGRSSAPFPSRTTISTR